MQIDQKRNRSTSSAVANGESSECLSKHDAAGATPTAQQLPFGCGYPMARVLTAGWLLLVPLFGCAPKPMPRLVSPARCQLSSTSVPALPPAEGLPLEVAAEVYAPANIVHEDPHMTGPYPRDMIWLWFRDDASQAGRQAAVDSVGGQVVGGSRVRPGGVYYVRICHDGTAGPLHAALARLTALPQVSLATPDLNLMSGLPGHR
jgi:hypothetical protein